MLGRLDHESPRKWLKVRKLFAAGKPGYIYEDKVKITSKKCVTEIGVYDMQDS